MFNEYYVHNNNAHNRPYMYICFLTTAAEDEPTGMREARSRHEPFHIMMMFLIRYMDAFASHRQGMILLLKFNLLRAHRHRKGLCKWTSGVRCAERDVHVKRVTVLNLWDRRESVRKPRAISV